MASQEGKKAAADVLGPPPGAWWYDETGRSWGDHGEIMGRSDVFGPPPGAWWYEETRGASPPSWCEALRK